jgi:hypothetical protein
VFSSKVVVSVYWIPLLLAGAGLAGGWALSTERYSAEAWSLAILLCLCAGVLAYRRQTRVEAVRSGRGGTATVSGDFSEAAAGRGGDAGIGKGGPGGRATVTGNHSTARGGDGGRG